MSDLYSVETWRKGCPVSKTSSHVQYMCRDCGLPVGPAVCECCNHPNLAWCLETHAEECSPRMRRLADSYARRIQRREASLPMLFCLPQDIWAAVHDGRPKNAAEMRERIFCSLVDLAVGDESGCQMKGEDDE